MLAKDLLVTARASPRAIAAAFDPASNAWAISNAYEATPGNFSVELRKATASGSTLTFSEAVSPLDPAVTIVPNAFDPSIATAGSMSLVLLVWADARLGDGNGLLEVFGQFFDLSGASPVKVGANFSISEKPGSDEHAPRVVFDSVNEEFWVAWADDRDFATVPGGRFAYARSVGMDGTLGAEVRLGDATTWQDGLHAAAGSAGTLFVWSAFSEQDGIGRYRARLSTADMRDEIELYASPSLVPAPPAVAWDRARCRFLVVWQETNGGSAADKQLYGALLAPDATVIRPRFQITSQAAGAGSPRLDWASGSSSFVATFGSWDDAQAYTLELDGEGNPVGAPESVHESVPDKGTYFHEVAAGDGEVLVISNDDYLRVDATLLGVR